MRTPDRDAEFTAFVSEHRPRLVRAARLLAAGDEALAEDLVQTTLTKAYLAWPKGTPGRRPWPMEYDGRTFGIGDAAQTGVG